MMVVVDASALAALLFGEPDADRVAERLGGAALFSPSLIRYELASVCRKKMRRYPDQHEGLAVLYRLLVLHENALDDARHFCSDLVEDFHGLDDADHRSRVDV